MKSKEWKMRIMILLFVFLMFSLPCLSFSQEYPTKPINLLIGYGSGASPDVSIRLLAPKAEKFLGQPLIITNNAGGGGSVAYGIVAKEKPDGYHLAGGGSSALIRVPQFRTVPYKLEDFIPIMHYAVPQSGLVVRADSPWKTLKELVEYARTNPGKVTYSAVPGTGTVQHLSMEYIAKQEMIQWTMIPFAGDPVTLLLGGHVTACVSSSWIPHAKAGTLRLLVTHGEKRMKSFPQVPTLRELGYDFINDAVFMIAAPKATPLFIVKKLDDAFRNAMDAPEFLQYMEKLEFEVSYRNYEDTKKFLEESYRRLGKMIIDLKIPREVEKK